MDGWMDRSIDRVETLGYSNMFGYTDNLNKRRQFWYDLAF